ncbi:peptidase S8 [Romboutsia maritimum]|uniref:Peptidase S8 n=1 Tax=Romboutsia maritimum TaxID=2020948 RepID=A0A371IVS2_9FIRM|nr:bifunctional germination protease/germinant receptor pseudoprotease CspBA [Romboutsia maritimum]RDY24571.1 peptidase S8 [Romboutsia maritimum]
MIIIDYEVVVKYNGDILKLEKELNVTVEILSSSYAIITSKTKEDIDKLLSYPEIEYIEKPFILETQDVQSFSSTGISMFKNITGLTGKGTILGIIDSGIDYTLPIFRDNNGKSKILYYWDQSIEGTPPDGFREGSLYTNEQINDAIDGKYNIPISTTSTHGTHVSGICAGIATEASMIVVRVGRRQTDTFSKSTEFMRAIKFVLDKSLELKMPVSINVSYGSNEGSHRGESLFEQFMDDMCLYWKNNIVVAAGNNGDKGGHKRIQLENDKATEVEFIVGENEKILNINIWPEFIDNFSVHLVNPSNQQTQNISLDSGQINNTLGETRVTGYFYTIAPYSLSRRITIQLKSNTQISPGIWSIVFNPIEIIMGNVDLYLPTSEGLSKETRFLSPTKLLTVTVPGTASKVITVGSYNSRTDTVSVFSGQGDIENGIYKPDLLAPGENIISYLPGGSTGALTGTSMATPHVTGTCSLLMEWGIVRRNDLYLYSQKLKSLLLKNARRTPDNTYPNNSSGFGFLNLRDINLYSLTNVNQDLDVLLRNKKRLKNFPLSIIVFYNDEFEDFLKEEGLANNFFKLSDNIGILDISSISESQFGRVLNSPSVIRIENTVRMAILGSVSQGISNGVVATEEIGINFFKNNPNISITGRGVLIAVADTGIDYLHPDFIYPDGTSKIAYLWDQTKEGNPPKGYYIGTEYTREDINEAIARNDPSLSQDEVGHGTMISGICAGLGNVNKEYAGMAEDAELIVIKLGKIGGYYNNAMSLAASQYAIGKSVELKMPLVINISLGSNNLAGFISRENALKSYFVRGLFFSAGAGNEGNTETHASGKVEFKGASVEEELELLEDEEEIEIDIWVNRPDKIDVIIISPTGEPSKDISVANYDQASGLFNLEDTKFIIKYIYPTSYSGQQFTRINLINVKAGIWKIRLTGNYIINGIYHMYLPNRAFLKKGTKFREPDPFYTTNYPSIQDDIMAVGAYDTINNSLWQSSSRGPTIAGTLNPQIVAPGVNIIAPYPGNKYATVTGTSAAAAHVSGAAALYFQYTLVDRKYPYQAFTKNLSTFIQAGATRSTNIDYPNYSFGYGILNVRGMYDQFR